MMNKNYICWYENKSIGIKAKLLDISITNPGKINIISEGMKIRTAAFNLTEFKDKLEVYNFMNETSIFVEALMIEHSKDNNNTEGVYEDVREFMAAMCKKHPSLTYEVIERKE